MQHTIPKLAWILIGLVVLLLLALGIRLPLIDSAAAFLALLVAALIWRSEVRDGDL